MNPKALNTIRRDWLFLFAIVLFGASIAYFLFVVFRQSVYVPKEFFEARGQGAVIAESIVKLSGEAMGNLKMIGQLDEEKKYSDGLDMVLQEISRNEESRKSALALSSELEKMATAISKVKPDSASEVALQAVLYESQIVQRLINYNSYLYQLLDFLRSRFAKGGGASGQMVADLISKMNNEISSINTLNEKYKELMVKFDSLTKTGDK